MTTTSFSTLGLDAALLANLESMDYQAMTPVQAQSLPAILQGDNLIAQAETGTGKTAVFGIGLLTRLNVHDYHVQAMVLCPTRELADQVSKEIRRLASYIPNIKLLTLCGGVPYGPQAGSLAHGAHIIVGTPAHRQTLLFSATYPEAIKHISTSMQNNPGRVSIEAAHTREKIRQLFFEVADKGKRAAALVTLLGHYHPASCAIFCNTRLQCQAIADTLQEKGFSALALHGDLEQRDRDQIGKIDIFDHQSYVAIERAIADKALQQLTRGKIKGRYFKVSKLQ